MMPSNGSVSPNTNSRKQQPAAGDAQVADGEPGHRRDDERDRDDADDDE